MDGGSPEIANGGGDHAVCDPAAREAETRDDAEEGLLQAGVLCADEE